MKNLTGNFLYLLKNILIDIVFLYKNFFHWNFSKIIILIAATVVGLLLSFPFFLFAGILAFIDPIEWNRILSSDANIFISIIDNLAIYPVYLVFEIILFGLGIVFLFLGMSYHIVLESRLYLTYFKKEKLAYKNNYYFDPTRVYTYLGILFWILFYLSLPLVVFVSVFLLLFICYNFFFLPEVILSIIMFIVLVACSAWFMYLAYRVTFSYLIFTDEDRYEIGKKSKFYVKKSFEKTAGKVFFKFLGVFIVFAALLAPFNIVNVNIDNNIIQIKDYFSQDYYLYETGQPLQGALSGIANENRQEYYNYLGSIFSDRTDDELISELRGLYIKQIAYGIFFFLFIAGIFTMILTSFYKRVLHLQWGKIKKEKVESKKKIKKGKGKEGLKRDEKLKQKISKKKDIKKKDGKNKQQKKK